MKLSKPLTGGTHIKYFPIQKILSLNCEKRKKPTMTAPTSAEARAMIQSANNLGRSAARYPMSWLGFTLMCTAGEFYLIATFLSPDGLPAVFWVVFGLWSAAAVVVASTLAMLTRPTPKQFGTRWSIMMVLWTFTWMGTVSGLGAKTDWTFAMFSIIFLSLAVAGPMWELMALRNQKVA